MNYLVRGARRCLLSAVGALLLLTMKAQDAGKTVSLDLKNVRLSDAVNEVRKQTDMNFFYSVDDLNKFPNVTLHVSGKPLAEVLDRLLAGTNMQFTIEKNTVVIKKKPVETKPTSLTDSTVHISGIVSSPAGTPLSGASVMETISGRSTLTDLAGKYSITIHKKGVLRFTYVGMRPQQLTKPSSQAIRPSADPRW